MGLEDIWDRLKGGASLNAYNDQVLKTQDALSKITAANGTLSPDDEPDFNEFMTAVRGLTENQVTDTVFRAYGARESAETPQDHCVSLQMLTCLSEGDPSVFSLDEKQSYIDHLLRNDHSFTALQKYPDRGMGLINLAVSNIEELQGFMILTDTERGSHRDRFADVIRRAVADGSGDQVAAFFTSIMIEDVDEDYAVARLRSSPSFQAGANDSKFLEHIAFNAPALTAAVDADARGHEL